MSNKNKALLIIIVGAIIGGATSSVTKIGLLKLPPFIFTFLRFAIASLFVFPLFIKEKVNYDKSFFHLMLISLLPVLNIGLFVIGVKTTTASIGQMLYAGSPILTALFVLLLFNNKMSIQKWLFILLGLFGVILVILLPLIEKNSLYAGDLKGNMLILIGVIVYSLYVTLSKEYQKKYSPIILTSVFLFLGAVVFFFLSIFEFNPTNLWYKNLSASAIYSVLYISVFATVGNYLLGQYAIKYGGAVLSSLTFYLLPIFAYISAYLLLGEKLTAGLIIGTIITFISITFVFYSK